MPDLRFRVYTDPAQIPQVQALDKTQRFAMQVVATVLPFRVNQYVVDELIDWSRIPADPLFQLTFPQRGMLGDTHFSRMADLLTSGADRATLRRAAHAVRCELNPHPDGQQALNQPWLDGRPLAGMQHKYRETLLVFPTQGQTCHSYCSFCFRWAQFNGDKSLRMATHESADFQSYLQQHPEISDVLLTGGDPLVMKTRHLAAWLRPLLRPAFAHVQSIRLGTKSLSFWPYRYLTDADADDLLHLLEELNQAGKQVAFMAHYNHWRELESEPARAAVRRVRATGTVIRSQAPVLAHINDNADIWARLWRTQIKLGMSPYYLFIARDTGAGRYFQVPLVRAWEIYRDACQQVSGLARTARGPSMSTLPGKVEILGIDEIHGEKVLVLRFLQARDPTWTYKPFFAQFDAEATWLTHLKPAFGAKNFFFE